MQQSGYKRVQDIGDGMPQSVVPLMATAPAVGDRGSAVDYYFGGRVAVRLIDASAHDRAAVAREIGLPRAAVETTADLSLRFVDALEPAAATRSIGEDVQIVGGSFLVRGSGPTGARAQIPFDQLGRQCEVVCERGLRNIPFLVDMINLAALGKGILPIHASAFVYRNVTALVVGSGDGGKTGTLLSFAAQGAQFVGDDWSYWDLHQNTLYGLPAPVRVRERYLKQLPEFSAKISRGERVRLKRLRVASRILDCLRRAAPTSFAINRVLSAVERRQCVFASAERLFGDARLTTAGAPEKIFIMDNHLRPHVAVEPLKPAEVVRRMLFVLDEEAAQLQAYYRKFRYTFPQLSNPLLEGVRELQQQLLREATVDKDAFVVHRPPRASLASLFGAISPYLSDRRQ